MKTIGLIGGLSWHSSAEYYRLINEGVQRRLGGHHSAEIAMESLDFAVIRRLQQLDAWDEAGDRLAASAWTLEAAGADLILICSNLMHKVAEQVALSTTVPLLHIADAVASEASRRGFTRLGLMGTRWVMEENFYRERLALHGIDVVVPDEPDRTILDRVIFDELTQGRVEDRSRAAYRAVIARLAARGADAALLACTEIDLLIGPDDSQLPLLDSTAAHAAHAVEVAIEAHGTASDPKRRAPDVSLSTGR